MTIAELSLGEGTERLSALLAASSVRDIVDDLVRLGEATMAVAFRCPAGAR